MHRPSVPPGLASVVMRCLEKRAADRWQSAAEIIPQLDAVLTPSSGSQPTAATGAMPLDAQAMRRAHPVRVAVLFVAAALVILAATWWVERRFGLPGWVLPMAVVLLAIGLPIMLLTAQRERLRLHQPGRATTGTAGTRLGDRLFTWRGALTGGVLALAASASPPGGS